MAHVIRLEDLSKRYGKKKVVNGVNLSVERGHICGLIGPNGAGKTTIMKMIAGVCLPSEGTMELFGSGERLEESRARASFLIEAPYLEKDFTAGENMEYVRRLRGIPDKARIHSLLELVGLADVGKKRVGQFSLGMRQRLGIAMALLPEPEFMVLDEPVNGLDPEGIVEVRHLLRKLQSEKGITILISSHLLSELSELCTDFAIINRGKLVECLSREALLEQCRSFLAVAVDDVERLTTVLERKLGIREYAVKENREVHIYERLDETARISRAITEAGLTILKLNPEGENLENYYLSRVTPEDEGGEGPAMGGSGAPKAAGMEAGRDGKASAFAAGQGGKASAAAAGRGGKALTSEAGQGGKAGARR